MLIKYQELNPGLGTTRFVLFHDILPELNITPKLIRSTMLTQDIVHHHLFHKIFYKNIYPHFAKQPESSFKDLQHFNDPAMHRQLFFATIPLLFKDKQQTKDFFQFILKVYDINTNPKNKRPTQIPLLTLLHLHPNTHPNIKKQLQITINQIQQKHTLYIKKHSINPLNLNIPVDLPAQFVVISTLKLEPIIFPTQYDNNLKHYITNIQRNISQRVTNRFLQYITKKETNQKPFILRKENPHQLISNTIISNHINGFQHPQLIDNLINAQRVPTITDLAKFFHISQYLNAYQKLFISTKQEIVGPNTHLYNLSHIRRLLSYAPHPATIQVILTPYLQKLCNQVTLES